MKREVRMPEPLPPDVESQPIDLLSQYEESRVRRYVYVRLGLVAGAVLLFFACYLEFMRFGTSYIIGGIAALAAIAIALGLACAYVWAFAYLGFTFGNSHIQRGAVRPSAGHLFAHLGFCMLAAVPIGAFGYVGGPADIWRILTFYLMAFWTTFIAGALGYIGAFVVLHRRIP